MVPKWVFDKLTAERHLIEGAFLHFIFVVLLFTFVIWYFVRRFYEARMDSCKELAATQAKWVTMYQQRFGSLTAVSPAALTAAEPQASIAILSHQDGNKIPWESFVYGTVEPPNAFVQVLLLSDDAKWHQQVALVQGSIWQAYCVFGSKDKSIGKYQVVAVVNAQPIRNLRSENLPSDGTKSRPLTVFRA